MVLEFSLLLHIVDDQAQQSDYGVVDVKLITCIQVRQNPHHIGKIEISRMYNMIIRHLSVQHSYLSDKLTCSQRMEEVRRTHAYDLIFSQRNPGMTNWDLAPCIYMMDCQHLLSYDQEVSYDQEEASPQPNRVLFTNIQ